jgi:hypothetical protein
MLDSELTARLVPDDVRLSRRLSYRPPGPPPTPGEGEDLVHNTRHTACAGSGSFEPGGRLITAIFDRSASRSAPIRTPAQPQPR